MPTHLTEYVRDRARNAGDPTFARFLDVFHHRMASLFYRAWAVAQPVVSLDRDNGDRFSAYVGTTFGLGEPALRKRDTRARFRQAALRGAARRRRRVTPRVCGSSWRASSDCRSTCSKTSVTG